MPELLRTSALHGFQLCLEFIQRGDRLGHRIAMQTASGDVSPILESVEGAADEDWPPSPPLQSLSYHALPGLRRAALLVGMAGASHWSASIEQAAHEPLFLFDIACRYGSQPQWLGSQYELLHPDASARVAIHSENARITPGPGLWKIEPDVKGKTARWQYSISLVPKP